MHARPSILLAALVGALALPTLACGGSDDDIADPTARTFETVAPTEPLFTRTSDEDGQAPDTEPTGTGGDADLSNGTDAESNGPLEPEAVNDPLEPETVNGPLEPGTTPPTVPDTGVPGIDSTDDFCRSWSEFAGSFQALATAWAVGDQGEAARSEVAASGAVSDAADALDAHLPAELESERAEVSGLVEPLSRRAEAARDLLLDAGIGDAGVDALAAAWLDALIDAGVDDPTIAIVVPANVDASAFATAAMAFAAAKPSIVGDPSLIVPVETPLTNAYLIANCPDQGTLGGNDNIGP